MIKKLALLAATGALALTGCATHHVVHHVYHPGGRHVVVHHVYHPRTRHVVVHHYRH